MDLLLTGGRSPGTDVRASVRPVVAIVLATFAVYVNSFGNAFVWDDFYLIVDNPAIKHWAGLPALFVSDLFPHGGGSHYYRPLQAATYLFDYHAWDLVPAGFHLTSTALHAGTAVVLYSIGAVLLRDRLAALVGALLWAIHPIHTEAVTYLAGRADPLAGLCMLAAVLGFLGGGWRIAPSVGAFFLALLARESAVVLPLLLVVVDAAVRRRPAADRVLRLLPYAGVLALYLALRAAVVGAAAPLAATAAVPLPFRLLTMAKVIVGYLALAAVPVRLHMERSVAPAVSVLEPAVLGSIVVVAGVVAAAVFCRRRARPVTFGIAWFLVALLPAANLLPLGTFMAEHWLYVPSMGLALAAGWGIARLGEGRGRHVAVAAGLVVALYGGLTARQNLVWRDGLTLCQAMLPLAPQSPRLFANLGLAFQEAGEVEKARATYEHLLTLHPAGPEAANALNNLGNIHRDQGRYDAAIEAFSRALAIDPRHVLARNDLALTLEAMGRVEDARRELETALALDPTSAITHSNLGNVFFATGDLERARSEFTAAVHLEPDYADAHNNLGSAYFRMGRLDLAESEYRAALRLNPHAAVVERNLAAVLQSRAGAGGVAPRSSTPLADGARLQAHPDP